MNSKKIKIKYCLLAGADKQSINDVFMEHPIEIDDTILSQLCDLYKQFIFNEPNTVMPFLNKLYLILIRNKELITQYCGILIVDKKNVYTDYFIQPNCDTELVAVDIFFIELNHFNSVCIDMKKKEIIRFEPNGHRSHQEFFDKILRQYLLTIFGLNFSYIGISPETCPNLQNLFSCGNGICVIYSIYYVVLKLKNPEMSQENIYDYLTVDTKKKLSIAMVYLIYLFAYIIKIFDDEINKYPTQYKYISQFYDITQKKSKLLLFVFKAMLTLNLTEEQTTTIIEKFNLDFVIEYEKEKLPPLISILEAIIKDYL